MDRPYDHILRRLALCRAAEAGILLLASPRFCADFAPLFLADFAGSIARLIMHILRRLILA